MKITPIINEQDIGKDGTYPIVIRISYSLHRKQKRKLHYTGFRAKKDWWENGKVNRRHPDHRLVNTTIEGLMSIAMQKIAAAKISSKPINPNNLFKEAQSNYFGKFIEGLRKHYLDRGQYTIYRKSARFLKEIEKCFDGDILFEDIDAEAVRKLESYMLLKGNCANTRHKKFRFYCSYFRKAIQEGLTEAKNPFEGYEIKTEKVHKEKLTKEEVALIEEKELKGRYDDVRNLFLFSYYCKGMRFENCVTTKWSQIKGDRIHFQLVKSNKPLSVKIHSKLQAILDKYSGSGREYIFPFMRQEKQGLARVKYIDSLNTVVNRYLKEIIADLEIDKKISFHAARHAFAYNMKKSGKPTEVIKDHLGHSRSSVTEYYLQSLDDEYLDNTLNDFYE